MFLPAFCVLIVWLNLDNSLAQDGCNQNKGDIFFMIDSSSSVEKGDFEKELNFVAGMVNALDVGADQYRVGVASFDSFVNPYITLDQYYQKQNLLKAVLNIEYTKGYTRTDLALSYLRSAAFSNQTGGRPDVIDIAVIITDGQSTDRMATLREAVRARNEGIVILTVGIGQADRTELEAVATSPEFVYYVSNFDTLSTILVRISNQTCTVNTTPEPKQSTTVSAIKVCKANRADVVFVLDSSASVGSEHFQNQINFTKNVIESFDVSETKTRIGLVRFDENVVHLLKLNSFYDKQRILRKISQIPYVRGQQTKTGDALRYLHKSAFSKQNGGRDNVIDITILMTDGKSQNRSYTVEQARQAKKKNIVIFVIGIGDSTDGSELKAIGSFPPSSFVFTVDSFMALDAKKEKSTDCDSA